MKKVLVIEDDLHIRENTVELLELYQFRVLTASCGLSGYESAKRNMPDLIICDMMMAGKDAELFLCLASGDELLNAIPLILFTADSGTREVNKRPAAGSDRYLQKPFSEEDLLHSIKASLDEKKKREFPS